MATGVPAYYCRATIAQHAQTQQLVNHLRWAFSGRAFTHGSCLDALLFTEQAANGTGLLHDSALTGASLYDDFMLDASPPRPARPRAYAPTRHCTNAIEYRPASTRWRWCSGASHLSPARGHAPRVSTRVARRVGGVVRRPSSSSRWDKSNPAAERATRVRAARCKGAQEGTASNQWRRTLGTRGTACVDQTPA